jgi:hypothetical protein
MSARPLASLSLALFALAACAKSSSPPPQPPAPASADPAEPAPAAPRFFVGALMIPGDPPRSIDWLIRYELGDAPTAKLWIPAQNVEGLAASDVEALAESGVRMTWETIEIAWTIDAEAETCSFEQAGASVECDLEEIDADEFAEYTARDRPQHPEPPFPYASVELDV